MFRPPLLIPHLLYWHWKGPESPLPLRVECRSACPLWALLRICLDKICKLLLHIIVINCNQSEKPYHPRVWGGFWWVGGVKRENTNPPPYLIFILLYQFFVVYQHNECLTPSLFYFHNPNPMSYSSFLENVRRNVLLPPLILLLLCNFSHIRPHCNFRRRGRWIWVKVSESLTFTLHFFLPTLDIVSSPPPPYYSLYFHRSAFSWVSYPN